MTPIQPSSRKLFAFDLDGTLLRSNKSVSDRTLEAITNLAAKGHLISIATARAPRDVARLLPNELIRHYVICYNGAETYQKEVKISEYHIATDLAFRLIDELINHHPDLFIGVESQDTFHVNRSPTHLFGEVDHLTIALSNRQPDIFPAGIAKILYEGLGNRQTDFSIDSFYDVCSVAHTDNGSLVQVMALGVSKWDALQKIANREDIANQDIIAFGDDNNDLAMLTSCGMGVAMANATQAVLTATAYRTASNDEDGVSAFLEANFLQ